MRALIFALALWSMPAMASNDQSYWGQQLFGGYGNGQGNGYGLNRLIPDGQTPVLGASQAAAAPASYPAWLTDLSARGIGGGWMPNVGPAGAVIDVPHDYAASIPPPPPPPPPPVYAAPAQYFDPTGRLTNNPADGGSSRGGNADPNFGTTSQADLVAQAYAGPVAQAAGINAYGGQWGGGQDFAGMPSAPGMPGNISAGAWSGADSAMSPGMSGTNGVPGNISVGGWSGADTGGTSAGTPNGAPGNQSVGGWSGADNYSGGGINSSGVNAMGGFAGADFGGGNSGDGGGGGGGGGGEGGGGEGGGGGNAEQGGANHFRGGPILQNQLTGTNPPGPDTGYASVQAGEGVLTKKAMEFYGPKFLAKLNKLAVPKS